MSENTKIEWCDHTFNPWIGCTQISPACDNCYAKDFDRRFAASGHAMHWGAGAARKRTSESNWKLPLRWNRKAEMLQHAWQIGVDLHGGDESVCIAAGFIKPMRPKVFCASLADVFDNAVDPVWRFDLATLICKTPNIDWLLLTKRIGNASEMLADMFLEPCKNVWLGATICNQAEADRDIPKLLDTPAHKRFLSMEPVLGAVDITAIGRHTNGSRNINALSGAKTRGILAMNPGEGDSMVATTFGGPKIDWVIVGGESGPNARPMHPDWARNLRDQCDAAGVPFLFKQWGEWAPAQSQPAGTPGRYQLIPRDADLWVSTAELDAYPRQFMSFGSTVVERVGKKAAGRLLDGREWNGVPV